jgi:serine/threonine protein kinase
MRPLLVEGTHLHAERSGASVTIGPALGRGGQGEVYHAQMGGHPVAVKWYLPTTLEEDPRLRDRLLLAVTRGAPSATFLWPADLVVAPGHPGLGYVMPLRETRFHGFVDLMKPREAGGISPTFRVLATAALELAEGYRVLHAAGLCYRDISFGNVALDPESGEIKICDNDNVDVNGTQGSVLGTPMFMAPEIVEGLAAPNTRTDLWSLAVLLFFAFMIHHPLIGRRELDLPFGLLDTERQRILFGTGARFIFDPADSSNAPVPGMHDNALGHWPIYPRFLRKLFTRAFTEGIADPDRRVLETEWRNAMVLLRDSIMHCPHCRAASFYDAEATTAPTCWSCQQPLPPPRTLTIGNSRIVLTDGVVLYPHHLDPSRRLNFSTQLATFARHPTVPELVGLRNLSDRPWQAVLPDGQEVQVAAGRTVVMQPGSRIKFAGVEGQVS